MDLIKVKDLISKVVVWSEVQERKIGLLGRKKEDRELSDEKILGSGDFVMQVLEETNELEER